MNHKPFRLFGGAPIITSHAATQQLVPHIDQALDRYRGDSGSLRYHDMAFTEYVIHLIVVNIILSTPDRVLWGSAC
jgi:hypothetical protein